MPASHAIILFAHGARDPQWALPFERLRMAVKLRLPGTAVELAYLELMQPALAQAIDNLIDGGAREIDIIPAFMAQGAHLKRDLPALIETAQARHPQAVLSLHPALGESQAVLDAMATQVALHAGTA